MSQIDSIAELRKTLVKQGELTMDTSQLLSLHQSLQADSKVYNSLREYPKLTLKKQTDKVVKRF